MINGNIIKKNQWLIGLLILVSGLTIRLLFNPNIARASTIAQRLSGRILLDVRRDGRAWYVNPIDLRRYYLGRPADAFQIMRQLGL